MLTLIHAPRSRSTRMLWLLEELGVAYELKIVDIQRGTGGGARDPENPHPYGRVPALLHDGKLVFESVAIMLYLTDAFPKAGLGPMVGDADRGDYLSWLAFYTGGVEPAFAAGFLKMDVPPGAAAWPKQAEAMTLIEARLKDRPFLLGGRFSALDVLYGSTFNFFTMIGALQAPDWLAAYVKRCIDRPAFARAQAKDNG